MAKLIYLSPSNHGKNQNKCLRPDCYEDKHTRPIAEVCAKYLKNSGFDVIIGQTSQNMAKRCQEANSLSLRAYSYQRFSHGIGQISSVHVLSG